MSPVKKHTYPPVNMGISLMLVTFIVLSMAVFAVLSLSGALKDYRYSQKNAQRNTAYYNACNLAEEVMARLSEDSLETIEEDLGVKPVFYTAPGEEGPSESRIEFTVPVNDSEVLQVILESDNDSAPVYKIVTWKLIYTKDWDGSSTLHVLGSD